MISFADAVNGWLQLNIPNVYMENDRILYRGNHIVCVFQDGKTCLGESTSIVPMQDPKFFEQLNTLLRKQIDYVESL